MLKIRLRRLIFAINHYNYLKRHENIKFPIMNALFGDIFKIYVYKGVLTYRMF